MAWTRVTGMLDSAYWHKVTSGVWFGKIPPNFFPLYTHPQGNLICGNPVNLTDPTKWVLSAGGVFNSAHNLSYMSLGLMAATESGSIVAQVCGPHRLTSPAEWGIAYGNDANFQQTPDGIKYLTHGSVGTISLDTFPRSDNQPFTVSMMLAENALTLSLLLNGAEYTLHTEQSYNTAVFAASLANPFSLRVNMYICGTAKDQYEAVDDGEGGYNYVGSPVCVLDWVNFASVE